MGSLRLHVSGMTAVLVIILLTTSRLQCVAGGHISQHRSGPRGLWHKFLSYREHLVSKFVTIFRDELKYYTTNPTATVLTKSITPPLPIQTSHISDFLRNATSRRQRRWTGKLVSFFEDRSMAVGKYNEKIMRDLAPSVDEVIKADAEPLVVFVNKKSGGQSGSKLLNTLKPELHKGQVCDLSSESAGNYLRLYQNCSSLRVLICGGDGTLGWIMDEAKKVNPNHNISFGIIPLGTGNDLYLQLSRMQQDPGQYKNAWESEGETGDVAWARDKLDSPTSKSVSPQLLTSDPQILMDSYKSPDRVKLDRWGVSIERVYGRRRKLLKLFLLHSRVKQRGSGPLAMLARTISKFWGFGVGRRRKGVERSAVATTAVASTANYASKVATVGTKTPTEGEEEWESNLSSKELRSITRLKLMISKLRKKEPQQTAVNFTMNNYFGVGIDGAVSLGFHNMRQRAPSLFFNRWVNKLWYGLIGIRTMLFGWSWDLSKCCQLQCDGKTVKIPPGTQGIIVLNVNSYAGGSRMWGTEAELRKGAQRNSNPNLNPNRNSPKEFTPASIADGKVEVVAVSGVNHLGAIKAGLRRAIPLAQGRSLQICSTQSLPMQLDGEPWRQKACKINIDLSERVNIMLPTAPQCCRDPNANMAAIRDMNKRGQWRDIAGIASCPNIDKKKEMQDEVDVEVTEMGENSIARHVTSFLMLPCPKQT